MKYILILYLFSTIVSASEMNKHLLKPISVFKKKKIFISLLLPIINKIDNELNILYKSTILDIKHSRNLYNIKRLKEEYKVDTDKKLLMAIKPHPKSIVLAQAAIESAWATSRFFKQANNIFGLWSINKKEPRIAALEKRGKYTIWLKKFVSLEDSMRSYYKLLAKSPAYSEFRQLKMQTDDAYLLTKKLNKYSERGIEYCSQIEKLIRYNKFTKYD
ncbi:MAG: hypothetical protein COB17_01615 [Sulfurimonas sp.]|nr:MAG: hypothetical protein COB17_01615 [Sulfurimonas sp.]